MLMPDSTTAPFNRNHVSIKCLVTCEATGECVREQRKGKKRKKHTHEVVSGFRVNSVKICFIPHIVGNL